MITSPPKRGMALVVVLVLLAVMMLVTITLSGRMQQQLGRTRSQQEYQQALWYSASAESLALSALSLSLKNEKRVHLAQPWASGPRFFPLPQGQIAVTLRDAQACFNLNALAQPTTASRPLAVQQLIALISRLDVPAYRAELIAESLWEFIDEDRSVQTRLGREDSEYLARSVPFYAANQPLADISEMRVVQGMDAGLYQKLKPLVCALPMARQQININTLDVTQSVILEALFDPWLSPVQARALLQQRPAKGWEDVDQFLAQPLLADVDERTKKQLNDERLQQWLQTDAIRLYIPGEWISVWQVELPDVPRKQIPTILPALLEEELNQDIDELHFAPLKIDQQLATVAVIHQQHMRNIAQWLQANGITRATVAPDWMSIPCGFMAGDAQRVICRIDECRGWSAGRALAPVMFRAQLNEQNLPISLTVVGIAPEELSAWAGADAERLTVTALPAITTYGESEGNLLTGPWQPRVSYRKQWARWRVMILPILLILVALVVERGVTLWSVSEQVAQSRTQAEKKFLTLFPEQKRIVNLRSQVTMALKKYRPQADDTRLLAELSAIASTLKSASLSDIEMRGFTFDQKRQTLHLQLRAANFASFDKLRSALAADYVVQQDALQKEGDAVSGGVTLRRK
ncbi:type II secretion system protein L [Escherichia coli KOEGE 32 (66a)]|nr:type II secretion system protein L [Escherichia coli KOEGE 32 (66a)]